ncbi:MAG: hypothetical protein ACYTG6_05480 [Planctomycetota bacterium]|jgi:hypothetical protein
MMTRLGLLAGTLAVLALCASDAAALDGWLHGQDEAIEAAKKSGKPILYVTIWKDGI